MTRYRKIHFFSSRKLTPCASFCLDFSSLQLIQLIESKTICKSFKQNIIASEIKHYANIFHSLFFKPNFPFNYLFFTKRPKIFKLIKSISCRIFLQLSTRKSFRKNMGINPDGMSNLKGTAFILTKSQEETTVPAEQIYSILNYINSKQPDLPLPSIYFSN